MHRFLLVTLFLAAFGSAQEASALWCPFDWLVTPRTLRRDPHYGTLKADAGRWLRAGDLETYNEMQKAIGIAQTENVIPAPESQLVKPKGDGNRWWLASLFKSPAQRVDEPVEVSTPDGMKYAATVFHHKDGGRTIIHNYGPTFKDTSHVMHVAADGTVDSGFLVEKKGDHWEISKIPPFAESKTPQEISEAAIREGRGPTQQIAQALFGGTQSRKLWFPRPSITDSKLIDPWVKDGEVTWQTKSGTVRAQVKEGKLNGDYKVSDGPETLTGQMRDGVPIGDWVVKRGNGVTEQWFNVTANEDGAISCDHYYARGYTPVPSLSRIEMGFYRNGKFTGTIYYVGRNDPAGGLKYSTQLQPGRHSFPFEEAVQVINGQPWAPRMPNSGEVERAMNELEKVLGPMRW